MTNRFFIASFFTVLALFLPGQGKAQNCAFEYELIYDLRNASFGSYNVWDSIYGEQGTHERFASGYITESGNTLVVGERAGMEGGVPELILAQIDRRGRVIMEETHKIANLGGVVKMLPMKSGFMVVANRTDKSTQDIWLGFFNMDGKLKAQKSIKGDHGALVATDITTARDGKGFALVAIFKPAGTSENENAILYRLDGNGGVIAHRSYLPGPVNAMLGIDPAGAHDYIATGYIIADNGRKAGWIVKLDSEGNILWQRPYTRGRESVLKFAQDLSDKYIVVSGTIEPSGEGGSAAWVMTVNITDGEIGWQRYYKGDYHYEAKDLTVSKEGMISVMVNGVPLDEPHIEKMKAPEDQKNKDEATQEVELEKKTDFVRLLSITPRGDLFISDEYFNGEGGRASQMITGPAGERIIIGETNTAYQVEAPGAPEVNTMRSLDGWVLAGTSVEPAKDPCLDKAQTTP